MSFTDITHSRYFLCALGNLVSSKDFTRVQYGHQLLENTQIVFWEIAA